MAHNYGQTKTPAIYLDFFNYYIHTGGVLRNGRGLSTHQPNYVQKFTYLDPYSLQAITDLEANNIGDSGQEILGYSLGNFIIDENREYYDYVFPRFNINYVAFLSHEMKLEGRHFGVTYEDALGREYAMNLNPRVAHMNAELTTSSKFSINNHGSSIIKFEDDNIFDAFGSISVKQYKNVTGDIGEHDNPDEFSRLGVGAVSLGTYFELPQSPEMSIGMEREYDFIEKSQSISGKSYNTVTNNGAAFGHGEQPFGTYDHNPYYEFTEQGYANINLNHHSLHKMKRAGRRRWELSFSQLSAKVLFHAYESGTIDKWTNTGIDIIDFPDRGTTNRNTDFDTIPVLNDDVFFKLITMTHAGRLPFIFQPDSDDNTPLGFCLAELDMSSFSIEQESFERYSISFNIKEIW